MIILLFLIFRRVFSIINLRVEPMATILPVRNRWVCTIAWLWSCCPACPATPRLGEPQGFPQHERMANGERRMGNSSDGALIWWWLMSKNGRYWSLVDNGLLMVHKWCAAHFSEGRFLVGHFRGWDCLPSCHGCFNSVWSLLLSCLDTPWYMCKEIWTSTPAKSQKLLPVSFFITGYQPVYWIVKCLRFQGWLNWGWLVVRTAMGPLTQVGCCSPPTSVVVGVATVQNQWWSSDQWLAGYSVAHLGWHPAGVGAPARMMQIRIRT